MIKYFQKGMPIVKDKNGKEYYKGTDDQGYNAYAPVDQTGPTIRYFSDRGNGPEWRESDTINTNLKNVTVIGHQTDEQKNKIMEKQLGLKSVPEQLANNKLINSNDNTIVSNGKKQNPQLDIYFHNGAIQHANEEKANPVGTAIRYGLSAIPLVVAAAPLASTVATQVLPRASFTYMGGKLGSWLGGSAGAFTGGTLGHGADLALSGYGLGTGINTMINGKSWLDKAKGLGETVLNSIPLYSSFKYTNIPDWWRWAVKNSYEKKDPFDIGNLIEASPNELDRAELMGGFINSKLSRGHQLDKIPRWLRPIFSKKKMEAARSTKQYEDLPQEIGGTMRSQENSKINYYDRDTYEQKFPNKIDSYAINSPNKKEISISVPDIVLPWQQSVFRRKLRGLVAHEDAHTRQLISDVQGNIPGQKQPFTYWDPYSGKYYPYQPTESAEELPFWEYRAGYWEGSPNELLSEVHNLQQQGYIKPNGEINDEGLKALANRFQGTKEEIIQALKALEKNGEYKPMQIRKERIPVADKKTQTEIPYYALPTTPFAVGALTGFFSDTKRNK